jgi:hypothetical protein
MWTAGKRFPGSAVAFVCGCLFGRGDADSFVSSPRYPSPPFSTALFDLQSVAWTKNQPNPVFAEVEQEEEEGEK